tara:strand:- start:30 stop:215 length:186 start_codon:yes stop_codon:yes gene_type:complete
MQDHGYEGEEKDPYKMSALNDGIDCEFEKRNLKNIGEIKSPFLTKKIKNIKNINQIFGKIK